MLLIKRQGGVSEEELLKKVNWLYSEILARRGSMTMNMSPSQATVRNALKYLETFVDIKKDVFAPTVKITNDYKNIQMLAYYRNSIIHLFLNECYIATALQAFGDQTIQTQDVSLKRLWEQTEFLSKVLREEFMVRNQIKTFEDLTQTLKLMQDRGFLTVFTQDNQEYVRLEANGKFAIQFLSSLLLPFVESYWVTLSFVNLLPTNEMQTVDDIDKKVQTLAETMFNESMLIYFESCSRESIGNALIRFSKLGAISQKEIGGFGRHGRPTDLRVYGRG